MKKYEPKRKILRTNIVGKKNRDNFHVNYKRYFLACFVFFLFGVSHPVSAMNREQAADEATNGTHLATPRSPDEVIVLTDSLVETMSPGIYQSPDIELILSFPCRNFTDKERELVVFDIDQVLITARADPYSLISDQTSRLFQQLSSAPRHVRDSFRLYLYSSESPENVVLMDPRIKSGITGLREQGINCMCNTAMDAWLGLDDNFDMASARLKLLQALGIELTGSFPSLREWNFDSLDETHVKNCRPLFKDSIIFSSLVPKHVTQTALFRKLGWFPTRMVFIDDNMSHLQGMYMAMRQLGINCYCFHYTRKQDKPLKDFFSLDFLRREYERLEIVLRGFLADEPIHTLFSSTFFSEFIRDLNIHEKWRLWK